MKAKIEHLLPILWGIIPIIAAPFFHNQHFPKITIAYILVCLSIGLSIYNIIKNQDLLLNISLTIIDLSWFFFFATLIVILSIKNQSIYSWEQLFYYLLLFAIHLIFTYQNWITTQKSLIALVVSGSLASIYGIYQFYSEDLFIHTYLANASSFGSVSFAGAFLVVILPFSFVLIKGISAKYRWIFLLTTALMLNYLFLTRSRASWLACFFSLLVFAAICVLSIKQKFRQKTLYIILAILLPISLYYHFTNLAQVIAEKTIDVKYSQRNSRHVRIFIWDNTSQMIRQSPFTGIGPGQFAQNFFKYRNIQEYNISEGREVDHPHNTLLLILAEIGIIGGFFFLCIILLSAMTICGGILRTNADHKWFLAATLAALSAWTVNSFFSSPLLAPATGVVFAMLTGIASSVAKKKQFIVPKKIALLSTFVCCFIVLIGLWITTKRCMADISLMSAQKLMLSTKKTELEQQEILRRFEKASKTLLKASYWCQDGFIYLERGRCLIQLEEYTEASDTLEKALLLSPQYENIYISLGICYTKLGNSDQALAIWKKAVKLFPQSVFCHYNLAKLLIELQQGQQALRFLHKTIVLDPQKGKKMDYQMNLAVSYQLVGNLRKALYHFGKAEKASPQQASIPRFYIAKIWEKLGHQGAAITHLNFITKHGSKKQQIKARIHIARIYEQLNQPRVAMTYYFQILQQNPQVYEAMFPLGRLLYEEQKFTTAQKFFANATQLRPSNHHPWLYLAKIALHQKQLKIAQKCLMEMAKRGYRDWQKLEKEKIFRPIKKIITKYKDNVLDSSN